MISRGISLIKQNGHYVEHRYPSLLDLDGLTQGVDYFLGGYNYDVSEAVAEALAEDGYSVTLPGYTDLYLGAYS